MIWHPHPSAPQHLRDAYCSACRRGVRTLLDPPVQDLVTVINGLVHRFLQFSMPGNNTKAECSQYRALPTLGC